MTIFSFDTAAVRLRIARHILVLGENAVLSALQSVAPLGCLVQLCCSEWSCVTAVHCLHSRTELGTRVKLALPSLTKQAFNCNVEELW